MGGVDKGLRLLNGKPLIAHVIDRLTPQVDTILISANRNEVEYRRFGYPVQADGIPGFIGPLAGLHAGLIACATPLLVTAACDSPLLPSDLVAQLRAALTSTDSRIAVPRTLDGLQPTFALMRRDVLPALDACLAAGERSLQSCFRQLGMTAVDFPDSGAFANINTPEELAAFRHD